MLECLTPYCNMAARRAVMSLLFFILLILCVNIINVDEGKKRADILKDLLKKKGVSILHQNVRGLLYNKPAIEELVFSNKEIDVLTLSETHISAEENHDFFHLSGYNFEQRHRVNGSGGGVGVYIKNSIDYIRRTDLEKDGLENIVIEIVVNKSHNFLVATHYQPPKSSKYFPKDNNELLADQLSLYSNESKEVIILGDFNTNYLSSKDNKDVKDLLRQHGFTQLIKQPTRVTMNTSTLIDIIATNNPTTIADTCVHPTSISDHDMVACLRKLNNKKFAVKTLKCRNYSNYDPASMNDDFSRVNWLPVLTARNVNDAVNIFNDIVRNIFDKHAPFINKRVKGRPCPWLDNNLKQKQNHRDRVLRKARKSGKQDDWNSYKKLRNNCNNLLKKTKAQYHKNILQENRMDPKGFWKSIKQIFPTKSRRDNNASNNENSNQTLADRFGEYYFSAVYKIKRNALLLKDFVWNTPRKGRMRTNKIFIFKYVSKVFVKNFLKSMKRTKATGLDELPPGLLRDCHQHLIDPLHHIINMSLQTGTVPSAWKKAKVIPLFKSGDKNNTDNYRPISVLPALSKLLEKAVHNQVSQYLEDNNLLNNFQFGYRAKRSTQLATTLLVDDIREAAEKGQLVGALFLDLSKAFDTISHDVILEKLKRYGVLESELDWFKDYLFMRSQQVEIGNQKSKSHFIYSGVPQGSILGPLLFLVFFNDFPESLKNSKCIQYADDTVIYATGKTSFSINEVLNDEVESLYRYCYDNELILNLKKGKTESMLFGTARRLAKSGEKLNIVVNGQPVHHVTTYTYLGNHLDSKLNLNMNFEKKYKKVAGRLTLLSKMRQYINVDAATKIYEMVIVPIILYSSSIHLKLTNTQIKQLSSLDSRAKKIIGGTKPVKSILSRMKIQSCILVRKCLNGETCDNFYGYFERNTHSRQTRNMNKFLKLPKIKLEFSEKSFKFFGAKVYNDLPLAVRECEDWASFRRLLNTHFDK